ncbi:MAG: prolipoprotein diacylglyceryl transferase [Ignavibacteriales bacterium]|nr:prolipoprotein diacylglyceryl transferase [Ignavibacterium sp.]MCZ2268042.1 prolipoprotein diacylglyceryl transferase [Ignavibacteriales bacterium]MEB2354452.1 prolipoprotein diacylglyceryl transferase [Ignavibacteriales bacterium]
MNFASIFWNVSPEIVKLGPISLRWYGLLFASALILGYIILSRIYKSENKPQSDFEQLSIYVILGTVIGARLGHCLFYDPLYYLSHPIEIIKVWEGGLASHGAAIGIITSVYLLTKKQKDKSMLWILDRLVIVVALGGALIRLGNLFNSEIIGKAANVPWAFIFIRVDDIPRHPAQLYESIFYFISFFILYFVYSKTDKKIKQGYLFGLFLILIFGFRFFVEFIKENQSPFEQGLFLNMGQLLSIPFVAVGLFYMLRKQKELIKKKK